ncbi:hypothetical protein ABK040_000024 [Willaertia magna]
MEESKDMKSLVYCIEMLKRQREQGQNDINSLKDRIEKENKGFEFQNQLYVSPQIIQPLPEIDFSLYLQFFKENNIEIPLEIQQFLGSRNEKVIYNNF